MTNPAGNPPPAIPEADAFDGSENPLVHDLRTLVLSRHSGITIETEDEERAENLLLQAAKELGVPLIEWSITNGMKFRTSNDFMPDSKKPGNAIRAIDAYAGDAVFVMQDFSRHLTEPLFAREIHELLERFAKPPRLSTIVVLDAHLQIPPELESMFVSFDIKLPDKKEYEAAIRGVIDQLLLDRRAQVEITYDQVPQFVDSLRGMTLNQARRAVAQVAMEDGRLSLSDISGLVELKAGMLERDGLLEYTPASALDSEIGGFENLRKWLDRQRVAFSAEARQLNLPEPKGLMLVGVQGCGKSLAAKTIARDWQLPLLRLDAGRLYDKFVGESEKNFRQAIDIAESLAPAVLWIDEIEKSMNQGDGASTDGGLSQRMFGAFLTWLQENDKGVFVVATANDLSKLPPELLRKGRFDEIFFVDLPTAEERAEIFRIHLTFRKQDPATYDLQALAAATEGFSGAEIEHVVVTAMLDGLQHRARPDTAALQRAAAATVPLSRSRREDIDRLRELARDRFVPVR
ncbi:MAG: AAA family ATPase [Solirubrobacterales bacterium]